MSFRWTCRISPALLVIVAAGCIPTADEPKIKIPGGTAKSEADLVEAWKQAAANPEAARATGEHFEIANELKLRSEHALDPILDFMADPNTPAESKVFTVESLGAVIPGTYVPRLKEMAAPGGDETVRACATMLLAYIRNEEAIEALRPLAADPEPRVQFSAKLGLARAGDEDIRSELLDFYHSGNATKDHRVEIVLVLLDSPRPSDKPVLIHALEDKEFADDIKIASLIVLERHGTAEDIPELERIKSTQTDDYVLAMIDTAIQAIRERSATASETTAAADLPNQGAEPETIQPEAADPHTAEPQSPGLR